MFSTAMRGLTLSIFVIGLLLMGQHSVQANDIFVPFPPWNCVATQVNPDNTTWDRNPAVNLKYIVWQGDDGNDDEIFVQNRSTGVVTQITNNVEMDQNPQIYGHHIVWEFYDTSDSTWDIALYHIKTGLTQFFGSPDFQDRYPQIEGDYVVWDRTSNFVTNVGMYHIPSGIWNYLGYNIGTIDYTPAGISAGKILYRRNNTTLGQQYVEVYDTASLSTEIVSSGLPAIDEKSQLAIHGDVVVWVNKPAGLSNSAKEIYAYNLVTDTLTQVTADNYEDTMPRVFGNDVVFVKQTAIENYQVYHYALLSGTSHLLDEKPIVLDVTFGDTMAAWTDDGYLTVYDLAVGNLKTFANIGTFGWLFVQNNQVFFGGLMPGDTEIVRVKCGAVSVTIDLPEASASLPNTESLATTPTPGLIPLP